MQSEDRSEFLCGYDARQCLILDFSTFVNHAWNLAEL